MRQLTASDHLWFAIETEHTPMHVTLVALYDSSERPGGAMTRSDLQRLIAGRLAELGLAERVVVPPLSLDLPYWVAAGTVDVDYHVLQTAVARPGGWAELKAAVAAIAEQPLDHDRPLWQLHLLTGVDAVPGLPAGAFAVAVKVHHGQFDGTALYRLLAKLHFGTANGAPGGIPTERIPSAAELLARVPVNATRRVRAAGALSGRLARSAVADRRPRAPEAAPPVAPRTRFGAPIRSRERVFDSVTVPLAEMRAISRLVEGATINDAFIAVASGALRRYLRAHGELPARPLICSVPVSAHQPHEGDDVGNRIGVVRLRLDVQEADPRRRLELARSTSSRAKQALGDNGAGMMADLLDLVPTNLLAPGYGVVERSGLLGRVPGPTSGVSLTNVPGPRQPLYLDGARLTAILVVGFLLTGMGLLLTAGSYVDDFTIGFTSTPQSLPDTDILTAAIAEAFGELRRLVAF